MFKIKTIAIGLMAFALLPHCSKSPTEPRELTPIEKSVVDSDNKFGLKLFREINAEEGTKNIFISPLSVSIGLGMTMNGASGDTYEAMKSTLEFVGLTEEQINNSYRNLMELLLNFDPKVVFQIANSIWYRNTYTFKESFFNLSKEYFDAEVSGLNFSDPASVNIINGWIEQNTNGKIKEIISKIDLDVVMFLINAIYFKGIWTYQFKEENTQTDNFRLSDNSWQSCKMMNQSNNFYYFSDDYVQVIDLPYSSGMFSMLIVLPISEVDVDDLIEQLDQDTWNEWLGRFEKRKGIVYLPRFKLEYGILMNDALTALGMGMAFSNMADFIRMYEPDEVYLSRVIHKSFVEVNEEGTEASAVTVVEPTMGSSNHGSNDFFMKVNRPFIFAIRDNHSGSIIFIGKIVNPNPQ